MKNLDRPVIELHFPTRENDGTRYEFIPVECVNLRNDKINLENNMEESSYGQETKRKIEA